MREDWKKVLVVGHKSRESSPVSENQIEARKCIFAAKELAYLGHIIGRDGLKTEPKKVSAIVHAPIPANVSELRSSLGLVTNYGKFIPALSAAAFLLNQLLFFYFS